MSKDVILTALKRWPQSHFFGYAWRIVLIIILHTLFIEWLLPVYVEWRYGYDYVVHDVLLRHLFVVLFVMFVALRYKKIVKTPIKKISGYFYLMTALAAAIFYLLVTTSLYKSVLEGSSIRVSVLQGYLSVVFIIAVVLVLFGREFFRKYIWEIGFLLVVVFSSSITHAIVDTHWSLFSSAVLWFLGILSNIPSVPLTIDPSGLYLATYDGFSVYIGPLCSGFTVMSLYTIFFSSLVLFTRDRVLLGVSLVVIYAMGLFGTLILNVIRILSILLVGAYYSEQFAVTLFHNNAGAVFFLLYFLAFLRVAKPYLYKKTGSA